MEGPVTEDEILACEKRSQLLKLVKRFESTISLEHVTSVEDIRTRLLLAVKKRNGEMKDITSLTKLFEKVQDADLKKRKKLRKYLQQAEQIFYDMGDGVNLLSLSKDLAQDCNKHIDLLKDDRCPIVVAGEVSSGKSTLLNLFLGKIPGPKKLELPTSTLSCTGRVCELTYGKELHAKLRKTTGEVTDIELDEKLEKLRDAINMQDKTPDSFNKFDVVQIFLPMPFLKSGITLVDTPGIGVDDEDSSIVKEYVKNHNVFGFIFTVHASAGGGVNQKFQSLLQTLAGDEYLDNNGDRKLDPRSVVFCCNFWDEVPEGDKPATKKLIIRTIASKPFLRGFDPTVQLFFMNSKQTYYTWQAGFITNEFDGFINGMQEFFSKGKLKKLRFSYNYIEDVLERSLHSLRSYLYWAKQQKRIGEKKQQTMLVYLRAMKDKLKTQRDMLDTMIDNQVDILAGKMTSYLMTKDVMSKICTWTKADIYLPVNEMFSYEKTVFEYKLDCLIDDRISEVLLQWEMDGFHIHQSQCLMVDAIYRSFTALGSSMDRFERGICNSNLLVEDDVGTPEDDIAIEEMAKALHVATKQDFDVVFGKAYASTISEISSGPSLLLDFLKAKKTKQKSDPNKGLLGRSDREVTKYMKERSAVVLDGLQTSSTARELVKKQMTDMRKFLNKKYENLMNRMDQNENLVKNLTQLIDNTVGTADWYQNNTTKLRQTLDDLLAFGVRASFHKRAQVQITHQGVDECFMPAGMYGSLYHAKLISNGAVVSVKKTEGMYEDKLTDLDKHFIIKHLREWKKSPYIPRYLGTDVKGDLVLDGKFVTVRKYFMQSQQTTSRAIYIQDIAEFFLELGHALQYLHYQNFVHIEVSLDSLMVKETDSKVRPLLSSLSEKKEVQLAEMDKQKTLDQFYLPPEVLAGPVGDNSTSHWYDFPGDMYGLGLVIVELWCQTLDVFQEVRNSLIKSWRAQENPGKILLQQANHHSKRKIPKDLHCIVKQLLQKDPGNRMTAREFVNEYKAICEKIKECAEDLSMCSFDKEEGDTPVPKPRRRKIRSPSVEEEVYKSSTQATTAPNIPKDKTLKEMGGQLEYDKLNTRPATAAPNIPKDKTLKEMGGQLEYDKLNTKRRSTLSTRRKEFARRSDSIDDMDEDEVEDTLDNGADRLPSIPSTENLTAEEPETTDGTLKRIYRNPQSHKKKTGLEYLTKTQGRSFDNMMASVPDYIQYNHGANVVNLLSAQSRGRIYQASRTSLNTDGATGSPEHHASVQLETAVTRRGILWKEMSEVKGSGLLDDLSEPQRRLQETLFEIISSELAYKKSLQHLVETVIGDMEIKFDIKKGGIECNHLFSNIASVYKVSSDLCKIWETLWCTDVCLNSAEVCDTLARFFRAEEHRITYILYYKNVIYQQRMCSGLSNKNEEFRKYTKDLGINRLSLYDGYLALPFQRIPRYRILVEAVIKSLPGDDISGPEYQVVQECLDTILTFVAQCNNAVKKMEDLENMIALENKLDFGEFKRVPVISEHREITKHGSLKRMVQGQKLLQKAFSGPTQIWELHLFSDLVIMAQSKKQNALLVKCHCKPSQVYAEDISKSKAEELLGSCLPTGCNHLLKMSFFPTGEDSSGISRPWYILSCHTSDSQLRWIEALSPEMPDKSIDYAKIINYSNRECPVVQVTHSYRGQHGDELTIYEGEILKILRKMADSDWCEGEKLSSGERGWFHGKCAVEIENPTDRKGILQEQNKVMQMTMRFNETNPYLQQQLHSLKELQQMGVS